VASWFGWTALARECSARYDVRIDRDGGERHHDMDLVKEAMT
jgi:hypothetical protein